MQRLYSKPKARYQKPEEFIKAGLVDLFTKKVKGNCETFLLTTEEIASLAALNKNISVHVEADISCYGDGSGDVDEVELYFSHDSDEIIPNPRYQTDLKFYEEDQEQLVKLLAQWEEQEKQDKEKAKLERPKEIAKLEKQLQKLKEQDAKDRE